MNDTFLRIFSSAAMFTFRWMWPFALPTIVGLFIETRETRKQAKKPSTKPHINLIYDPFLYRLSRLYQEHFQMWDFSKVGRLCSWLLRPRNGKKDQVWWVLFTIYHLLKC